MINYYLNKIKNGDMNIDDVPEYWRSKVQEKLDEMNKPM